MRCFVGLECKYGSKVIWTLQIMHITKLPAIRQRCFTPYLTASCIAHPFQKNDIFLQAPCQDNEHKGIKVIKSFQP